MTTCSTCGMPIPEPQIACLACVETRWQQGVHQRQLEGLRKLSASTDEIQTRTHQRTRHLKMFLVEQTWCGKHVQPTWRHGVTYPRLDGLTGLCAACCAAFYAALNGSRGAAMRRAVQGFRLTAPPPLSENDIERQCIDLLHLRGYWVARLHCGRFKTADGRRWITGHDKGTPDYAVEHELYPGFLLETKRPAGDLSPEQTFKHCEIRAGYRIAIGVCRSGAELAIFLDEHEARSRERWKAMLAARSP